MALRLAHDDGMRGFTRTTRIALAGGLGMTAARLLRRRRTDPAHAPGKRRLGPPPRVQSPAGGNIPPDHDQPWVRRTHSDSQQRRFRR